MSSKTVEEAAWAEYQQWNEQNRASGPNRDWIAWYQGYTAGAAHGAAEERARIQAIADFYPEISGKALINAANEMLP